jgi:SAM-dependent MidA family methyltransferase
LTTPATFVPWDVAWQRALYGAGGFYRRPEGAPASHFRTSVHASGLLAGALARLARAAGLCRVVDVGSGRGELLTALSDVDPDLALVGVDVVGRPAALDRRVQWMTVAGGASPDLRGDTLHDALVVAHEWLDDVPCPVVEVDSGGGWRQVEVDPSSGLERLGETATAEQQEWLTRWWTAGEPGSRAEVGLPRDRAWAGLVTSAARSMLLAVDYSHARAQRPPGGSLAAYRAGQLVPPVPDGTCDVTAHVALDAVALAGEAAGAVGTVLTSQQTALRALGVSADRPDPASARDDPAGYLSRLQAAGEAAELLDPGGLGGFGWLVQSRGPAVPDAWAGFDSTPPGSSR